MLSKKCKYAIHALVHMAKKPAEKYLIKDISETCNIPKKFLEAILLDMKRAGFLGSKQGKGGGYFLRLKPSEINLTDVIRLFDGAIAAVPCASLKFYDSCAECEDEETCTVRHTFIQVRKSMIEMLKSSTLDDMVTNEARLIARKKKK